MRIPLEQLSAVAELPLTRERVFNLARSARGDAAGEVHIVVTVDLEDGPAIEVATVEVNTAPDGDWWLQYVSHPSQSWGLTALIAPCYSDYFAFLQLREALSLPYPLLPPFCAQDLEDEGLGPLAILNLRPRNPAPVVPTTADLNQLVALIR